MAKKLWGGRFKKKIDKDFEEFSKSIQYDYKLAEYDINHSIIHAIALKNSGILKTGECKKIILSLNAILQQIGKGKFKPNQACEDIHTEIQNRLEKDIGKLALKMHTLRSRNDQIVFDAKWYCLDSGVHIAKLLVGLSASLKFLAKKYPSSFMVGYTHTQKAQVVKLSDYISAFSGMFFRDSTRLMKFIDGINLYIGAGALAGSSLKVSDYDKAIKEFFKGEKFKNAVNTIENSLDSVSDRDFIIEFLSILSILQMHLSRLSEDFILYSTKEFNFLDLPEEFCTGSSLMPHKKNPDFLELVRGSTGKVYGNLVSILTTMKGLPLTYNRDMQMDKEPLFSSVDTIKDELCIMVKFIKGIKLNKQAVKKALEDESLYATELAEYLVYQNVAFKDAYDIVGELVRYSEDNKVKIKEMPDTNLKKFHKGLNIIVINKIMNPEYAVKSKKSISRRKPKINA